MSIDSGLLHGHLRDYKDGRSQEVRARMSTRLAALLAVFLQHHEHCIGPFDAVVPVPSPARTAMESVLLRLPYLRERNRHALRTSGLGTKKELRADRFHLTRQVSGERLLLLDDTFTSGATIFSAASALPEAGATVVCQVVLGRHVNPDWGPSRDLLAWLQGREWDHRRCCRCDGERADPERML